MNYTEWLKTVPNEAADQGDWTNLLTNVSLS